MNTQWQVKLLRFFKVWVKYTYYSTSGNFLTENYFTQAYDWNITPLILVLVSNSHKKIDHNII